jgi:peptide/nickel transport system permease protein
VSAAPVAEATSAGRPAAVVESPVFLRRLLRRPLALACLAYLAVLVAVAIVAPIALPSVAGEHAGDLLAARQNPSWHHLLGTDALGRDVLARLLVGSRVTMLGVADALIVVLALGVPLGLAAGFLGGWLDRVVGWLADLTFSIPAIIVILIVLAVHPQSMLAAMVTLGVLAAPGLMRVVRSATLPVRKELYIDAAQVSGLSLPYIIGRHVLPRISGAIIIQTSLLSAVALLVQTGLAFLNLIVAAPAPSWGGMVADGVTSLVLQPWLIWPAGMAIAITVVAFGLLGDVVRDATTEGWAPPRRPRQRHGAGAARDDVRPPEPETSDSLISIEHLGVALPSSGGPIGVLEDVSFDIGIGEIVGLVGESGCGKTMTAMAILGLLPAGGNVTAGQILFADRDLAALSERELRLLRGREIALVSQDPMVSLNPALRVGWQIAESLRCHRGLSRGDARAQAVELLRRVRLPDPEVVARRYPHELSGGMAQRVSIARALAGEPRLLIADEPTTALDVTVQAEILSLLRELQRERKMAILLVTHDWGVVADICDRAVVMYAGEVVERASLVPIFQEPLHPYTKALLSSNPHHFSDAQALPTIPGTVPAMGAWPDGCRFHPRCPYATPECGERKIPLERPAPARETRCIHYDQLGPVQVP